MTLRCHLFRRPQPELLRGVFAERPSASSLIGNSSCPHVERRQNAALCCQASVHHDGSELAEILPSVIDRLGSESGVNEIVLVSHP